MWPRWWPWPWSESSAHKEQFRSGAFQVGYMTDPTDESTFVPVVTFNDNKYKQLVHYRVFFGNVVDNGNNRYIAFRYGEVGEEFFLHTYYYYLDDVAVRTAPACMPPNRPTVVLLYPDSAVLACAFSIDRLHKSDNVPRIHYDAKQQS